MPRKCTIITQIFIFLICTLAATQVFAGFFSKYERVKPSAGEIAIPLNSVDDGKAHYFIYNQEQMVKFFVVKSADGVIRAAFDACDVCFREKKGYTQSGEYMVCNNCGRKFHSNRINIIQGGCNPAPLKRTVRDDNLIIRVEDVVQGVRYF